MSQSRPQRARIIKKPARVPLYNILFARGRLFITEGQSNVNNIIDNPAGVSMGAPLNRWENDFWKSAVIARQPRCSNGAATQLQS